MEDLVTPTRKQLEEEIREEKEKAWAEGYDQGFSNSLWRSGFNIERNPYTKEKA